MTTGRSHAVGVLACAAVALIVVNGYQTGPAAAGALRSVPRRQRVSVRASNDLESKFSYYGMPQELAWRTGQDTGAGSLGKSKNLGAVEQIGDAAYDVSQGVVKSLSLASISDQAKDNYPIKQALGKIDRDMILLDGLVAKTGQLTARDLTVLGVSVATCAASPFLFSMKVVELLVPSLGALCAAIGISAEYVGRVAVCNGKEVAAASLATAAEAEGILAQGERVKAVLPLCVGIATTAVAFALLAPALIESLSRTLSVQVITELYLLFPLAGVLSASVAGLAKQEVVQICQRAIGVGNRRFASANSVGRTWLSQTEMIQRAADSTSSKWGNFAVAVLPSPLIATFFPGSIELKTVICAALAATQAAYYLAVAEGELARAIDAVAVKTRSAAVSDTYANQGARSGAILPFTSALAGVCAAATAAVVEFLPVVPSIPLQSLISLTFPGFAAVLAAGASVSKARCEVDAAAAREAAETLASERPNPYNRIMRPVRYVLELIRLSGKSALSTANVLSLRVRKRVGNILSAIFGGGSGTSMQ